MKIQHTIQTAILGLALLGSITSSMGQTPISVPGLFNTGVDSSGAVLPPQSLEQHYSVSGASSIAYVVPPVYEPNLGWA